MKLLRKYVRRLLEEQQALEVVEVLEENALKKAASWLKKKGSSGRAKLKDFLEGLKEELSETKMGLGLLQKMAAGQDLNPDEVAFIKDQAKDLVSGTFLLGLFMVPGGGVFTVGLVKAADKLGVKLMPSSFRTTESVVQEKKRIARKKGQHRNSPNHSDLFTDENPEGTIHGLKFATVKDAEASVNKIKRSGKSHAHKTQAAVAMEQRAKSMGKKSAAAVYRKFINQQKEKTANKNESIHERFSREDFEDVYNTARMAHVGQTRRDGTEYFSHPSAVRNIATKFYPKDRVTQLAALLHDTLEDARG